MTPANLPSSPPAGIAAGEVPPGPPGPADLLPCVLRVVRAAVDVPDGEIAEDTELLGLPAFDSMKLVQIVEEIEAAAGVEIDPELIMPEAFASPRAIAETVAATATAATAAAGAGNGASFPQGGAR